MRAAISGPALLGLMLLLALGGCAQDPYARPFTWAPAGVNDTNLHAMVADPHDLVVGRSEARSLGAEAAPPVGRLLSGQRLPLSTESASGLGQATQSQSSSPGPSGNGGQ